jgi:signal transduction histidine kinase
MVKDIDMTIKKRDVSKEELKELFIQLNESFVVAQGQMATLSTTIVDLQSQIAHKDKLLQRKSRMEGLGQMAAGVAHEIRNPLGGMCLYTDMLVRRLSELNLEWECSKAKKVRESILALEQIVSDMLNFTQEVSVRLAPEDIGELISSAVDLAKGHNCYDSHYVDLSVVSATLCVDKRQLHQVFLNLILNAFQAMENKGQLTIRGRLFEQQKSYVITFCDSGTGIPEDKLEEIFNPFVSFKHGGTGLGLAIGHRVIEDHGGRIEVKNNIEKGVTFMVTLPIGSEGESSESANT